MTEEHSHVGALLEDIQNRLRVLAEHMVTHDQRFDRLDTRLAHVEATTERIDMRVGILETKVDKLETKVDKLETKVDKLEGFAGDAQRRLTGLEASASDTQQRLGRIETHLQLNGSNPRKPTRAAPAKRNKKR
jgi:chromosome segregation ATPase